MKINAYQENDSFVEIRTVKTKCTKKKAWKLGALERKIVVKNSVSYDVGVFQTVKISDS